MKKLHIKTGDTVVVLSGKEKSKQGKVLSVNPTKKMAVVEGVNMITCHTKPRKMGQAGGIIQREGNLRINKLMRVCPKCEKPTRQSSQILENGDKVQVCKHCHEQI